MHTKRNIHTEKDTSVGMHSTRVSERDRDKSDRSVEREAAEKEVKIHTEKADTVHLWSAFIRSTSPYLTQLCPCPPHPPARTPPSRSPPRPRPPPPFFHKGMSPGCDSTDLPGEGNTCPAKKCLVELRCVKGACTRPRKAGQPCAWNSDCEALLCFMDTHENVLQVRAAHGPTRTRRTRGRRRPPSRRPSWWSTSSSSASLAGRCSCS